jgi:hypothetical protein
LFFSNFRQRVGVTYLSTSFSFWHHPCMGAVMMTPSESAANTSGATGAARGAGLPVSLRRISIVALGLSLMASVGSAATGLITFTEPNGRGFRSIDARGFQHDWIRQFDINGVVKQRFNSNEGGSWEFYVGSPDLRQPSGPLVFHIAGGGTIDVYPQTPLNQGIRITPADDGTPEQAAINVTDSSNTQNRFLVLRDGTTVVNASLYVAGGIRLGQVATCGPLTRGSLRFVPAEGTSDQVEVCLRDANRAYAWRSVLPTVQP